MNNEIKFQIIRGKGSYGCNNSVIKIKDIFDLHKDSNQCIELRIIHCQKLSVLQGIQNFKFLKSLNLSCNNFENINLIQNLTNLQVLDVKGNKIQSLKCIQYLRKLIKIDASQNMIKNLDGFGQNNSQIQSIILYKNQIKDLSQLERFKKFNKLKQICFEKKVNDLSNPICQIKQSYFSALQISLIQSKESLQKIDQLSQQQVSQFFNKKYINQNQSEEQQQYIQVSNIGKNYQNSNHIYISEKEERKRSQNMQHTMNGLTQHKLMLATQRQADLERIIDMKVETIQQLKHKYAQLQMTNTNQYRQSIKKQAEFERVLGQVSQLSKAVDQKDQKINELHKRIEQLLKVNTAANNLADTRALEVEKIRKQFGQLRIENSQFRVLNKDQQNRLRELQSKTLSNIEDKSQKIEGLRSKNEQLMKDNYNLQRQQQQFKQRIRQLTQLLKEWQSKYEQTVRQLQTYHNTQKQQIFAEIEAKSNQANRRFDDAQRSLNQQWQQKINVLQAQYSSALQGALQKYNRLKKAYDEKSKSQQQIKNLLKSVMAKNTQNESTIKQFEQAVIKSKKIIISLTSDQQSLTKQHYEMKQRYEEEIRHLQNQLSKTNFIRDKLERDTRQLKITNQYLQKNFDNLNDRQKQFEQLLEKNQNLQTALDAKNVMLDDKNETIQSLKLEIQSIQKEQQGKIDAKEYQKLNQKYRRQKELLKSIEQQNNELLQQNKQLNERCQVNNSLQQQFVEIKDIMKKQEAEIRQKEEANTELIYSLEKLKTYSQNLIDQVNTLKNQKNKMLQSFEDKQNKYNRLIKQKQREYQQKINSIEEQAKKYKIIAQQFKNFTKTLNF